MRRRCCISYLINSRPNHAKQIVTASHFITSSFQPLTTMTCFIKPLTLNVFNLYSLVANSKYYKIDAVPCKHEANNKPRRILPVDDQPKHQP
ncbi:predicted coding region AF_0495 [Archaeoglobus fulgidus DSM 4304]|uniref:Uncharacterized protein AF_0495 n=1 Tax=Archaeoglobus fulgidus (strain ATCC 49558 / DSM 4304 / JCM 9628 / NBRC 100126 / VC-16) TaxID=224325 RepID=Y495_ARCFU|nr:RecName: Full=Uncharacterized protein AF_0495 [Archaeoglobus fulgidus DSM 4304]AAB90753.1 predicted coding region AF_0495 [Archaeoglobus fulgidus DSM 4304]